MPDLMMYFVIPFFVDTRLPVQQEWILRAQFVAIVL